MSTSPFHRTESSPDEPHPSDVDVVSSAMPLEETPVPPIPLSRTMLLEPLTRSRVALHLALVVFAGAGYLLIVSTAMWLAHVQDVDELPQMLNFAGTLLLWLVITVAAQRLLRSAGMTLEAVGLTGRRIRGDLAVALLVTACTFGVYFATVGAIWLLWPGGYHRLLANPERIFALLPDLDLGGLFLLMVAIATCEEIVFRGILMTHLRRLTGSWIVAILVASSVFAGLHVAEQEMAACIPLLAIAVVWSLFTIWRRSLLPAIVGHALFNFIQIVFLLEMRDQVAPSTPTLV